MVVSGSFIYGLNYAIRLFKRRESLKALERILLYLESEIRYRHSIMAEAFFNAAAKADKPFDKWLICLGKSLEENDDVFYELWNNSLEMLMPDTCFTTEDIDELSAVGQTLGYLDIEAQRLGLKLEIDNIHMKISEYNVGLRDRMRVSVIAGAVFGILVVILLV